jgi:hypothetical protein
LDVHFIGGKNDYLFFMIMKKLWRMIDGRSWPKSRLLEIISLVRI